MCIGILLLAQVEGDMRMAYRMFSERVLLFLRERQVSFEQPSLGRRL